MVTSVIRVTCPVNKAEETAFPRIAGASADLKLKKGKLFQFPQCTASAGAESRLLYHVCPDDVEILF